MGFEQDVRAAKNFEELREVMIDMAKFIDENNNDAIKRIDNFEDKLEAISDKFSEISEILEDI